MQAQLFRTTFRALCKVALLTASIPAIGQTAPPSTSPSDLAESQQAIAVVVSHFSVDPAATVPNTNKPLPLNGTWARSDATDSCPKTKYSCFHILYRVAGLGVSCDWTVLLRESIPQGIVLDMNDDAAHYFVFKMMAGTTNIPMIEKPSSLPIASELSEIHPEGGTVRMLVQIDTTGHVQDVKVLSGSDFLRESAIDVLKRTVYKPLIIDSIAVPIHLQVNYIYKAERH
jgi:TonB family protein